MKEDKMIFFRQVVIFHANDFQSISKVHLAFISTVRLRTHECKFDKGCILLEYCACIMSNLCFALVFRVI